MNYSHVLALCLVIVVFVLSAGCTQNAPASAPVPATTAPVTQMLSSDTVKTLSSPLGSVLTDANGKILYFFAADVPGNGKSACYNGCTDLWPVFSTDSLVISPPLAAADFSVITRTDGMKQTSYQGRPLYYFSRDTRAGEMSGENFNGIWYVARPDYTVTYSRQPDAGTFLTDGAGRTLYFFALENPGEVACTGSCLANWPVFSSGPLVAPTALKSADFSVTTRPDGSRQSLFMGRPLYYFAKDTQPGDLRGQGINNAWYAANISGYVPPVQTLVPTTLPTPTPTVDYYSNSGGGGY